MEAPGDGLLDWAMPINAIYLGHVSYFHMRLRFERTLKVLPKMAQQPFLILYCILFYTKEIIIDLC